ncbi:MAG: 3-dehydroquinate synthase, partial [Saprospiraceae bacterium]|nr:3-dehydroquinate synthase [Saprospiraceae bacterium]
NYSRILILCDENTRDHCLPYFLKSTGLPADTPVCVIPAGEQNKNLETASLVWKALLETQLDRHALLINLGGGVVGDLGGFCAATWKRGIAFVQVPTTLLAMTDAAIGGKTGIDFYDVKNTLGVFQNPAAVFADPAFLGTLSQKELHSGFAEVLKHAVIKNPLYWQENETLKSFFNRFPNDAGRLNWTEILQESTEVKLRIVREDPHEKNKRMLLNFGHTVGHALETYFLRTEHPLTHGEAIAQGMLMEADVAETSTPALRDILPRLYPPRPIPQEAWPELWNIMLNDKKNKAGAVRFTVPASEPYVMKVVELFKNPWA